MAARVAFKFVTAAAFAAIAAFALSGPVARADSGGGGGSMGGGGGSASNMNRSSSSLSPAEAYQRGVAAIREHQYHEAVGFLRPLLRNRQLRNDPSINTALATAYIGQSDWGNARGPLETVAGSPNPLPGAIAQLGIVYLNLNEPDKAVEQQTRLTTMLGACDAACGDARRAQLQTSLDALTAAINAPPAAPATAPTTGWNFPSVQEGREAYAEAVGLINQQHYTQAFAALERARDAVGPNPDVLNYMGFVSRRLGNTDAALAYYNEVLSIDPHHRGATEYLGELYLQLGRVDDARRQLARLDQLCAYGCAEREELAMWIDLSVARQ